MQHRPANATNHPTMTEQSDTDPDASITTDASHEEGDHAPREEPKADGGHTRRRFGSLMLAGTAGLLGLAQPGSAGDHPSDCPDWRKQYYKYAKKYVPKFYKKVAKKRHLYRCIEYTAKHTDFWEVMGKKLDLHNTVVTAAHAYPRPNVWKVDKKAWDGILSDMLIDMPERYRKRRKYPVFVPVFVVYFYDGYYNAVAYLSPYGESFQCYGYAIKNEYNDDYDYDYKHGKDVKTWWWTKNGWGDASLAPGGILEGVPTNLVG